MPSNTTRARVHAALPVAAALAALSTAATVHAQYTQPHILYADASALPGGNGSDWLHAFRDLQDAIAAVPSTAGANGDRYEIRIAQGIYRPDRETLDRNVSFMVGSGVSLAGGFGGLLSPNPDQQNPAVFASILSGDLRADDGPSATNISDNSHHVVRLFGSNLDYTDPADPPFYRLTGLTIRAGNATDDSSTPDGAGVLYSSWNNDLYIYNCTFRDNHASNGAAITYYDYSKCLLDTCTFLSNTAEGEGGAVYIPYSQLLSLSSSTFSANSAYRGGGISASNAAVTLCIFSANTATQAAGLFLTGHGSVSASRIVANTASGAGGGLTAADYSILSCLIAHNSAQTGAGIDITGAADVANCTIVRNTASQTGAAILVDTAPITHSRIWNSILWNNTAPTNKSITAQNAPFIVDHCILQNGALAISAAQAQTNDLITTDPRFVDPVGTSSSPAAWADKDYRLASLSPAIDAGLDASLDLRRLGNDIAGAPRLNNSTCAAYARPDLGAYEFVGYICPNPLSTTYVRAAAAPGGDGRSWTTAFRDLQDALATPGVRDIWIAQGTYTADHGAGDRNARFYIEKQYVSIYGSFAGTENSPAQRTIAAHPTILSADLLHNDGSSTTSTLDNAAGIMEISLSSTSSTITLSGLTFTGAHAVAIDENDDSALRIYAGGSASIADCAFTNNTATAPGPYLTYTRSGAAINVYANTLDLQRCTFFNNSASGNGGALNVYTPNEFSASDCSFAGNFAASAGAAFVEGGPSTFLRCSFIANAAIGTGRASAGALYINSYGGTFSSCRFLGNLAYAYPDATTNNPSVIGGAVYADYNSRIPVFTNSLFAGNRCAGPNARGAAMYCDNAATLINCTIADNAAGPSLTGPGSGTAVVMDFYGGLAANCIFWNSAPYGAGPQSSFGAIPFNMPQTTHCIIQDSIPDVVGTLNLDPRFANPAGPDGIIGTADDDYSLRPDSPAIDAADSSRLPTGITTDLAGNPRFIDALGIANTGLGNPNFLDIGAFEFAGPHACLADFNNSGIVSTQDIFDFLTAWFAGDPRTDINGNGLSSTDVLDFITAWFAGC